MKTLLFAVFSLALPGASALRGSVLTYQFTIDTQTLSGQSDNLDFQLNPGQFSGAPGVSVVISGFALIGGSYDPAAIQLTGDASGSLSSGLALNNTTGFNDAFQPAILGWSLRFLATLSGPGVTQPASPGTFFGFSVYDNAGITPLLTTSDDGTTAGFNIDATQGVRSFAIPVSANGPSVATISAVPEPSTAIALVLGLAILPASSRLLRKAR